MIKVTMFCSYKLLWGGHGSVISTADRRADGPGLDSRRWSSLLSADTTSTLLVFGANKIKINRRVIVLTVNLKNVGNLQRNVFPSQRTNCHTFSRNNEIEW